MRKGRFAGVLVVAVVAACAGASCYFNHRFQDDTLSRGEVAYRSGDWSAAADLARAAVRNGPTNLDAIRLLARASARLHKDDAAEAIYRRLGTKAMEPEDLFLLGRGLLSRGMTGLGLASLGAARDADPDHPETLEALASYQIENLTYLQAARDAERLMGQPGWEVRGIILLARARRQLLEPGAAADLLIEAIRRDPGHDQQGGDAREVQRLLAACLLEAGRAGEAVACLKQILASGTNPDSSWMLSRALLMGGDLAAAKAALEQSAGSAYREPMAVEPSPYVGAGKCASCHAVQFRTQQQSRHAQSIKARDELNDLSWPERPLADRDNPAVVHQLRRNGDRVEAETHVQDHTFAAVIAYAIGSNHQGRSFVGRDREGQAWELRVSQYPAVPHWDRTSEHPAEPPGPDGYLGRPIADESVRRCVHCHATNFRAVQQPEGRPEAADHGIGCERCHGPGAHHLRAIERKFPDPAIARPRLASAAQIMALCGQCHKAPDAASPSSPTSIRFQAPTLVLSRCYNESGSLSCVTCHNPHRDAGHNAAEYEVVCLRCHSAPTARPRSAGPEAKPGKSGAACPINPRNDCLNCHMPRVFDAVPRAVFTDHHIRVREGPHASQASTADEPGSR